nr:MAG TPA: hypothetical protein [Crassvirales sp.]
MIFLDKLFLFNYFHNVILLKLNIYLLINTSKLI